MASTGGLLHWHHDAVATMELFSTFADFTETWFKSVTICIAAFWLSYRIYQVILKPVNELVDLLGLEVPEAPTISLAGVKADGVILGWRPPDPHSSVSKHLVLVNGIDIGEVSQRDTAVTIYNLKPNHSYAVRVVAANANFQSASEPIRFTTKPASSQDFFYPPGETQDHGTNEEEDDEKVPNLRPCKALFETDLQITAPPPMTREHSSSLSQKRSPQARRVSPILTGNEVPPAYQGHSEGDGSVRALTERLESLRRDLEDAERLEKEEADEFESTKASYIEERDRYKQQWKEKDDTSKDLRKDVNKLEQQNRNAQHRKNTAEKKLQDKRNERKKLQDDMARWEKEMEKFEIDAETTVRQREEVEKETEEKLEEHRAKLLAIQNENKELEENNKDKGALIKNLEEEKKSGSVGDAEAMQQQVSEGATADNEVPQWEEKLRMLQGRYQMAWNQMLQAEAVYNQSQRHLESLQQRRLSSPQLFAQTPTLEAAPVTRHGSNRRRRAGSIRSEIHSPSSANYPGVSGPPFNTSISSISPTFSSGSPFFNINNGMTLELHEAPRRPYSLTQAQVDALTGGAPMSPTAAGALLPSGLLADDAEQSASDIDGDKRNAVIPRTSPARARPHSMNAGDSSSLNASNRNSAVLPGLGAIPGRGPAPPFDPPTRVPSSPVSSDSRSPSVFASPKDSNPNLSNVPADTFEPDRRSIRSNTGSSRGTTSRFAGFLNLGGQRGKAATDDGPRLGSLKTSQTQSLGRQDPYGQSSNDTRRRGSHSGGGWMQPLSNAFSRTAGKNAESATEASQENAGPTESKFRQISSTLFPRSGETFFGTSLLNRSISPRPPSTHSSEVPFRSYGNQTGYDWPGEGPSQRTSPLGPGWMSTRPGSLSQGPSRRPSAQHALTMSDLTHLDPNSFDQQYRRSPMPAPIGTRPQTSQGRSSIAEDTPAPEATPPKFNPAAPSFNPFKRNKKTDDEKAKGKGKGKEKDTSEDLAPDQAEVDADPATATETPKADPAIPALATDSSPSEPRRSKDTRSISTDSLARDSLERSQSRTPSESLGTPSSLTPQLGAKDGKDSLSFMQRLSRKTSATGSKLKTPFSKEGSKGLFGSGRKGAPTSAPGAGLDIPGASGSTPDETDEDVGALSKSLDSMPSSSAAGSPLIGALTNESATANAKEKGGSGSSKDGKEKEKGSGWRSLKLSKKKDKEAVKERPPSINESMASETGDEEDVAEALGSGMA